MRGPMLCAFVVVSSWVALAAEEALGQSAPVLDLLEEGDDAFARGDYARAAKLYDRAIVAEPKTIDASFYAKRAEIFVFLKRPEDGLAWVSSVAEKHKPGNQIILAKKAVLLSLAGRTEQAVALAEEVLRGDPKAYALHLLVADHHFARKANGAERAATAYEAFLRVRPSSLAATDPLIRAKLGFAHLHRGDFAAAERELAIPARSDVAGTSYVARSGLCAAFTGLERWREAEPTCARVADEAPAKGVDPAILYNLARARLALGRHAEAMAAAARMIERSPKNVKGHLIHGHIYAAINDWSNAQVHYEEAAVVDPASPEPGRWLGRVYLRRSPPQPELAIAKLTAATRANPRDAEVLHDLASAYFLAKRWRDVVDAARAGAAVAGDDRDRARFLALEGDALDAQGEDFEGAVRAYDAALKGDPNHAGARAGVVRSLNRIASAKLARDDRDGARASLERAVEYDAGAAVTRHNLGLVLVEEGRFADAIPHLERARAAAPVEARVLYVLGRAYRGSGASERALESLRAAEVEAKRIKDERLLVDVYSELGPLLYEKGDGAAAVEVLKQAVQSGGKSAPEHARRNLTIVSFRRGLDALRAGQAGAAVTELERAGKEAALLTATEREILRFALGVAYLRVGSGRAKDVFDALARELDGRAKIDWLAAPYDRHGIEFYRAYALAKEGNDDERRRALRTLERLDEKTTGSLREQVKEVLSATYAAVAVIEYQKGNTNASEAALKNARAKVVRSKARGSIEHNLAVLQMRKKPVPARAVFERLMDDVPEALVNLGIFEEETGDPARALEFWKTARARGVASTTLDDWIARKQKLIGDPNVN